MAVPKKKSSKRRNGMRSSSKKITLIILTKCPKCGEPKRAHIACSFCGFYNGKKVLDVESKLDKKLKKQEKTKEKEEEAVK